MWLWVGLGICFGLYVLFVIIPAFVMSVCAFRGKHKGNAALVAFGTKDEKEACFEVPENCSLQDVYVDSEDGTRLHGRYIDAGFDKTVLFLHGYKVSAARNFQNQFPFFLKEQMNLLAADERGHGKSGGNKCYLGMKEEEDVIAWVQFLKKNNPNRKLYVYGISMGSTAMAFAAGRLTRTDVSGMILDCGFTSLYDQFARELKKRHIPKFLVLGWLVIFSKMLQKVDIRRSVKKTLGATDIPAFFIHGEQDNAVSAECGRANYEACASEKELWIVPGAIHANAFLVGGDDVKQKLHDFINKTNGKQGD